MTGLGAGLTASQRRVLEWLLAYPGVKLTAAPGESVFWTAWWASDTAREHMEDIVSKLGEDAKTAPRTLPLKGGTPRCTVQTFLSLQRRGFLQLVAHRKPGQGWTFKGFYQISRAGLDALAADHERGVPVEPQQPPKPHPLTRCECGLEMRGGMRWHLQSNRHYDWLRLQAYRAEILAGQQP